MPQYPVFTVGHSNRTLDDFLAMLRSVGVNCVADVRRFPRSRANPAFNIDTLPTALAEVQIAYRQFPDLGGRRAHQSGIDPSTNGFWTHASFHNYADFALTEPFAAALEDLVALCESRTCALMCSEAVWWRCHRRIIADYLLARGFEVRHLMGEGRADPASLTPGAVITRQRTVTYPA